MCGFSFSGIIIKYSSGPNFSSIGPPNQNAREVHFLGPRYCAINSLMLFQLNTMHLAQLKKQKPGGLDVFWAKEWLK